MKRMLMLSFVVTGFITMIPLRLYAVSAPTGDSTATLTVTSPGRSIDIYDGTRWIGATPLMQSPLDTGRHILRFGVHHNGTWMDLLLAETLSVSSGAHVERIITLPSPRRITSEPSGASVYAGDSLLGVTPALVSLNRNPGMLRFVRDGYIDATIPVADGDAEIHAALTMNAGAVPEANTILAGYNERSNTTLYLSGGVAVLSGVAAAYWKIKADELYDGYRRTGDASSLGRMRSMDTASGVSLVVSQIGLSVFTYLLLTR